MADLDLKPFWVTKNNQGDLKVHSYLLREFLNHFGFGLFQTVRQRTSDKILFQKDEKVLKIHNKHTVKRWVREYLENESEDDFNNTFETQQGTQFKVLCMWQDYKVAELEHILNDLDVWSEEGYKGSQTINLFKNQPNRAYIIFENGVVEITKDEINLLPLEAIDDEGDIWETEMIHHDISLTDEDEGVFYKFFNLTQYRPKKDIGKTKDWMDEYELNEKGVEELMSLRTAYGYLIHTYNIPDEPKVPFFIDEDSDSKNTNGRTGKTLVMQSVEHFKETVLQDGKRIPSSMKESRFQFSNVDLDTKLIILNDVDDKFDFKGLFSLIGSDMEVERKKENKFTIRKHKVPRIGITTNYVVAGHGTSHTGRRHIVEFGSYWARCERENEKVSDKKHIGQMLCGWDKGNEEWNHFYNFGFRCIQDYFKHGLVEGTHHNYEKKALIKEIEGREGDGQIVNWIDDWVKTTRLEKGYHLYGGDDKGISEDDLYKSFSKDNLNLIPDTSGVWDKKKFCKAVWEFTELKDGFHYNIHRANKGTTKSDRRWLAGTPQSPHIVITTDFDSIWLDNEPTENIVEDGMTPSQILKTEINQGFEVRDRHSGKDEVISRFRDVKETSDESMKMFEEFFKEKYEPR